MRHRSLAQGITVFVAVAMPLFVSLVGLAHLFVTLTRRRLQKKWRG